MRSMVAVKLWYPTHSHILFYVAGQKPAVQNNLLNLVNAYHEKYADIEFSKGAKIVCDTHDRNFLLEMDEKPKKPAELLFGDDTTLEWTPAAAEKQKALSVLENIVDEGISLASVEAMVKYFAMYPHVLEEAKNAD